MSKAQNINPLKEELPCEYADRIGICYTHEVSLAHKKINGQFFTPIPIARLMASYCTLTKKKIKILDPGCGTAILTCALVEHLVETNNSIEFIELHAYETDINLIPFSKRVLDYLKEWMINKDISFNYILHVKDFVLENADVLKQNNILPLFDNIKDNNIKFDIIISNPPYFKLSKNDKRTVASQELVSGQPNIYSFFMGISSKLLSDKGEMIFITPRSFASGNYFKAFRELFFKTVQIERIHLFNSRKKTFSRDSVLQETIIIKAIKNEKINQERIVTVSSSIGIDDILIPSIKYYKLYELINLHSKDKILHLPINDNDEIIMNLVSTWENVLTDLNIQISTGPVVSFRALDFIQNNYENGNTHLAPLFWLHNVDKMVLEWPKESKGKGQFIKIKNASKSLLLPNKNYILLRRFSTKDDKSRLIAAPYFSNYFKANFIGVENKVNYIYRKDGHLERNEIVGLCALLNSELFDNYFQIFNGNVNVSATELRQMKFPSSNNIKEIGNKIILSNNYSMTNINYLVSNFFELEFKMNLHEQN